MAQAGRPGVDLDNIFLTIATLYDYGFGVGLARFWPYASSPGLRSQLGKVARRGAGLRWGWLSRLSLRRLALQRLQPGIATGDGSLSAGSVLSESSLDALAQLFRRVPDLRVDLALVAGIESSATIRITEA